MCLISVDAKIGMVVDEKSRTTKWSIEVRIGLEGGAKVEGREEVRQRNSGRDCPRTAPLREGGP